MILLVDKSVVPAQIRVDERANLVVIRTVRSQDDFTEPATGGGSKRSKGSLLYAFSLDILIGNGTETALTKKTLKPYILSGAKMCHRFDLSSPTEAQLGLESLRADLKLAVASGKKVRDDD